MFGKVVDETASLVRNLVLTVIVTTLLLSSTSILMVKAEPAIEPTVTSTQATSTRKSISSYSISAPTSDGGWVNIKFVWQIGEPWRWPWTGEETGRIFDTPLTLQMSRFFQNSSLDFSVTYSLLYLIQYNDTNGNGLMDLRATRVSREEIPPGDIDWIRAEKPVRTYPLTPVFNLIDFERGVESRVWHWIISPMQNRTIVVNNVNTYEFTWNASAIVPTYIWSIEEGDPQIIKTTVKTSFGFHLILDAEKPQIKYDFKFSDISWAEEKNVKLTLLSAIQYHSKETAVVRADGESYDFDKTWAFWPKQFTISDGAVNTAKAFVAYSTDALVDGSHQTNAVKTSLQPLFLIPTFADVPQGVHIKGVTPGFTNPAPWIQYTAFSHQLGLPQFNESITQDPIMGIQVPLLIGSLIGSPLILLSPQILVLLTIVITIAYALYFLRNRAYFQNQKRTAPFNSFCFYDG